MPGLATIAPFGFSFDPVRMLAVYRALGAASCQFYRNMENPPTVAAALKASASAGVPFDSIHGVFGYDLDPSSPVGEHRRHCLSVYETEGKLAQDLGGPMVVVHPAAWTPGRAAVTRQEARAGEQYRRPFLAEFLRALAEIGERLGVVYLIENQPWNCYTGCDPASLARDVLAVGSSRIRMCLDTGHAHITTGDVPGVVRAAAPAIAYLHIHDNDGAADDHRMPGDGTIDWGAFARAVGETGVGDRAVKMLEVFYEEAKVEAMGREGLAERLGAALALT